MNSRHQFNLFEVDIYIVRGLIAWPKIRKLVIPSAIRRVTLFYISGVNLPMSFAKLLNISFSGLPYLFVQRRIRVHHVHQWLTSLRSDVTTCIHDYLVQSQGHKPVKGQRLLDSADSSKQV